MGGKGDDRKMDVIPLCRYFMITVGIKCILMTASLQEGGFFLKV